jgi:hypothetical protein
MSLQPPNIWSALGLFDSATRWGRSLRYHAHRVRGVPISRLYPNAVLPTTVLMGAPLSARR